MGLEDHAVSTRSEKYLKIFEQTYFHGGMTNSSIIRGLFLVCFSNNVVLQTPSTE